MNKINQNINSCARVAFIFNFSLLAFSWTSKLIRTKQELEKTADISRPHHWFPAKWRLRNENRDFIVMTCHYLPRTETSFSRWKCERKGRREGDNRRPFPSSLAVHHQSLAFRARLYDAKNEAPEEEVGSLSRSGKCLRLAEVNFHRAWPIRTLIGLHLAG